MKAKLIGLVMGIALLPLSTAIVCAQPATYVVDGSHTAVIFAVSHMGFSYTYGRFNKVEGQFAFDSQDPINSQFALVIDVASIDTNDAKRDEHLRNADFFNARQFPTIEFRSTQVKQTNDGLQLVGTMTMHGETKEITIPLQKVGEGQGPYGNYRCGFLSQFSLKRSDFGMRNMIGPAGDEITITVSLEGIQRN